MEILTQEQREMLESDDPTKFDENLMTTILLKGAEVAAELEKATRERLENKDWSEIKVKEDL